MVGTLRVVDGVGLGDAGPQAAALSPPRTIRGRDGQRLFVLLHLTNQPAAHVYQELRDLVAHTYWSSGGSITASLRRAAGAANRHLFQANLRADPSARYYGGLACAVLSDANLFILQTGAAGAFMLHAGSLERLPRSGGQVAPLGIGPVAAVNLSHVAVAAGDTLLLVPSPLLREIGQDDIDRVARLAQVEDVMDSLRQLGGGVDFSALVVRWILPSQPQVGRVSLHARHKPVPEVPPPAPNVVLQPAAPRVAAPRSAVPRSAASTRWEPEPMPSARTAARPAVPPRPEAVARPGPTSGERAAKTLRHVGSGIATAGAWLGSGARTLFRRMLPGAEPAERRRVRRPRPTPKESRPVMLSVAVGIPVLVIGAVVLTYSKVGVQVRFDTLIAQAQAEVALAEAAGGATEAARPHWEAMMTPVAAAADLRPGHASIVALESQARAALDRLDGVVRLRPTQLYPFGEPGDIPRQLIVRGQLVFVLDPEEGWFAQLSVSPAGEVSEEDEIASVIARTGQRIGGAEVAQLIDFAWMSQEGGRQTSGVVILQEDGGLLTYDPAWGDEAGSPNLVRSLLGTPPTGQPTSVGSFEGRFYILDSEADQIWRYEPQEDTYPDQPGHYFVTPPPFPLSSALDMAIDGYIYILYSGGEIHKFLRGERQEFNIRGVPGGMRGAVALAVDPAGGSDAVYVADQTDGRVVKLGVDGFFQAQFRAEGAFDAIEAIAIDEAAGLLYVIAGGKLYSAVIP